MEHFNIVQALCRSALAQPTSAVTKQVERLRDALVKSGNEAESKKLDALLNSANKVSDMSPSRIQQSRTMFSGEELTPKTQIPVDKETSTPIAEVVFPGSLPNEAPEFDSKVGVAIRSILSEWGHLDELAEIEAYPSRSCLIYGAPGTGKTHLALWMAQQMNLPVVLVRLDGLMSSFLGTTSRNIGNLFRFASKYNCILMLDEFDAIAKLRNDPQEVGEIKRVVNTLLQNLDSRRDTGFTIGITNHESLLDPAVWRRFDVQIEIPKPSPQVMAKILEKNLNPLRFDGEEIQFLTWCLDGGTGADSKTLVQWLKKSHVIEGGDNSNLVELLQRFALLNSGRVDRSKRNALAHSDEQLIAALLKEERYDFKQKDVASLMGITPSSVSKRIAKIKETGGESHYAQ